MPKFLGWSGSALVLGKLPVPGRPNNFDYSRAMVLQKVRRGGVVWTFLLSSIISLFFLPLSDRRHIYTEILSQRAV